MNNNCMNQLTITFLGTQSTGKTALIQQYKYGRAITIHNPTVDSEEKCNIVNPSNSLDSKIAILLDSSGDYLYQTITEKHILRSDVLVLVYSITDRQSYSEGIEILTEALFTYNRMFPTNNPHVVVVGNKIDLSKAKREISTTEGQQLADSFKNSSKSTKFFETSALKNTSVTNLFEHFLLLDVVPQTTEVVLNEPLKNKKRSLSFKKLSLFSFKKDEDSHKKSLLSFLTPRGRSKV
ncbi:GTP-binding protein Rit1, putative [Entamoeba invadens IP1]|uniref:GTP-binding protein Rit1, putative n=1 Tax=Entamoeba invadens IP1 TaxID=370355 RepID=A0A0A1U2Q5_ENTIV|nr:GTP-binding protein Rit1, putative [Entamoeba invadens IP1]ELP88309.1 GTP-binding protein Rit1, putative [Entamoeba invadens IP1]|eukprot:XP_004255080.1 GTP-binding protein Rit1, putative [Entamoeba invadens IP1]